ncbi:MAG: amino acid permease [Desulfobulbaceae bacterium]
MPKTSPLQAAAARDDIASRSSQQSAPSALLGLKELLAIGIGAMIGGGIFSVMGLAVTITGNATPVAFVLGGILAMVAGYSYIKLALAFRDDGASFTYLEKAFPAYPFIASITGWTVILGYIGTMALYAFTFGAYGSELLGLADSQVLRRFLSVGIILFFMIINLYGAKSSGRAEDIIVYTKIMLLGLLAFAGARGIQPEELSPFLDRGIVSIFMAAALIFVAYEGFQLITNTVCESRDPVHNLPRSIYGAIGIVTCIYVGLSFVAVGSLPENTLIAAREYALAVAAEPALGNGGRVLVSIAALLATASAINATMLGASRMMAQMATEKEMPRAFSFRNRDAVPWIAVVTMAVFTIALTYFGGLELIAAFSSMTFLLVSLGVSLANLKLHAKTRSMPWLVIAGTVLLSATILTLVVYLLSHSMQQLAWMGSLYLFAVGADMIFKKQVAGSTVRKEA